MRLKKKKKRNDREEQLADNLLPCDCAIRERSSEEYLKKALRLMNTGRVPPNNKKPLTLS